MEISHGTFSPKLCLSTRSAKSRKTPRHIKIRNCNRFRFSVFIGYSLYDELNRRHGGRLAACKRFASTIVNWSPVFYRQSLNLPLRKRERVIGDAVGRYRQPEEKNQKRIVR